ncbi:hypothetical protein KVG88_06375 [Pseudomonas sp. SWRI74]|uniref:Uncharacterized protein n=1 Tax=Pseudomonas azerbaijanoccidentalis TaxID=2842347 RepID=A0ABS6QL61_9PSED|nr:hypothetical protein [Pseudomonas azerbaijanoccidentalis]MBV4519683.1 hypothetical protein [Pseudomonas azerbaijanoccidentalis]
MKAAADAALAAQYRQCGKEPPDHCKPPFIEGEFEVIEEPKKLNVSSAFFGMGDPAMDKLLGRPE